MEQKATGSVMRHNAVLLVSIVSPCAAWDYTDRALESAGLEMEGPCPWALGRPRPHYDVS